jgi:hypothetical protein
VVMRCPVNARRALAPNATSSGNHGRSKRAPI